MNDLKSNRFGSISIILKTILLFLTFNVQTHILQASDHSAHIDNQDSIYINLNDTDNSNSDYDDYKINLEEHSLLELIKSDRSFLKKYPTNIMSSAQIIYAMIISEGVESQLIPGYDGSVPVYKIFSSDTAVTDNRRIIGHLEGIKAVVAGIKSQAKGSKTGVRVPLLVGTHGTGKSEFRNVIANALKNFTRSNDKKNFHMHEISWKVNELLNIPDIKNLISITKESEMRSPLHSSPFSILPQVYKDRISTQSNDILTINGEIFPYIEMQPDPISKDIRDAILRHFQSIRDEYTNNVLETLGVEYKQDKDFSPEDEVRILSHYMVIRRVIMGEPGTVPLIEAQGDEVDYQGLIMGENPIIRMLKGASHPWSWDYRGGVLSGSRNLIFLDEFFRNESALRDVFLGIMESRVVTKSGAAPVVPLDTVIIAATNSANLDDVKVDPKSHAQINRMRTIPFEWNIHPVEIAKILLYMNEKGMKMKSLKEEEQLSEIDHYDYQGKFEAIDVDKLFPKVDYGKKILTPDARYNLIYGSQEEDAVFISPHSIMFMADFIAATRMNTNVNEARSLKGQEQVIDDTIFKDVITRLKVLKNELNILASHQKELYELSIQLREGSFGLSSRVAATWLSEALEEARQEENDNTLTPVVLRKVFDRLAYEGSLEVPNEATRLKWNALMDRVIKNILVEKLRNDIYSSFHNDGKADEIYEEIIREILSLSEDEEAKEYIGPNDQKMIIDKERLQKVGEIFKEKTGQSLAIQRIATFYLQQQSDSKNSSKNANLLGAINEYLATSLDRYITVKDLLNFAEKNSGSTSVRKQYKSVESVLVNNLGYNKRSILDALRVIKEDKERSEH